MGSERVNTMTTDQGAVTIAIADPMSPADVDDFEAFVAIVIRTMRRQADALAQAQRAAPTEGEYRG